VSGVTKLTEGRTGNFRGLFELKEPADLVRKLRHDLGRMRESPRDQYAAFDFFITADNIVDWLHPADTKEEEKIRKSLRASSPLLKITAHLANGAKHFEATRHQSVAGTERIQYVADGYAEQGYFDSLLIKLNADKDGLEPKEIINLGGPTIGAVSLAQEILHFWNDALKLNY
jgi:hypothetical protein